MFLNTAAYAFTQSRIIIETVNNLLFCSDDQYDQINHDIETSVTKIKDWKAHILRTIHQETAKRFVLDDLKSNQVMLVIDWAMKFIPSCYRETQAEWYGKKGRPWHVSAVISKNDKSGELEVGFRCQRA